jgi:hypothetical protein
MYTSTGHIRTAARLITLAAHASTERGLTALLYALDTGIYAHQYPFIVDIVQKLLNDCDADDIDAADNIGRTPLTLAGALCDDHTCWEQIVMQLLRKGADISLLKGCEQGNLLLRESSIFKVWTVSRHHEFWEESKEWLECVLDCAHVATEPRTVRRHDRLPRLPVEIWQMIFGMLRQCDMLADDADVDEGDDVGCGC